MYGRQISFEKVDVPEPGDSPRSDQDITTAVMDMEGAEQDLSPAETEAASLSSLEAQQQSPASSPNISISQSVELQGRESGVQPGQQTLAKPKKKSVPKMASGYSIRTIVPAEKADVVSLAKAMHRESFDQTLKGLFQSEKDAALRAVQTGIYIGWRCPEYHWDCFRLGNQAKCFCGHLLSEHEKYTGRSKRVRCAITGCRCPAFKFIPSCPEEVGEMWQKKRFDFNAVTWRAKCRCKHTHEEHQPMGEHSCKVKGCRCISFESGFLCAACDRKWEAHETFFETTDMRKDANLPYGAAYLPFAEMPELRNVVLTGSEDDDSVFQSIRGGLPQPSTSNSPALPFPSSGPWRPLHDQRYKRT